MSSSLRDAIAAIVREACKTTNEQFAYADFADRILAIPEIADLLMLKAALKQDGAAEVETSDTKLLIRAKPKLDHSISTHSDG